MSDSIVSEDERFANYFRDRVMALDVPEPPREAMWAAIAMRRAGGARPSDTVALAVTPVVAPAVTSAPVVTLADGAPRSGVVSGHIVPAKLIVPRRAVPLQWAVPAAAALLFVGAGLGYKLERKQASNPGAPVAAMHFDPTETGNLVTASHFAQAKALLAKYTAEQRGSMSAAEANDSVASAARAMLQTTQTLIDSPMEMGADRRKLLEDLSDILMQIASPSPLPDDAKLVEQSINQTRMMQRLSAKVPLDQQARGI